VPAKFIQIGGHSIKIPLADRTHGGTYHCVGKGVKGQKFKSDAEVFVEGNNSYPYILTQNVLIVNYSHYK